jgi:hypothetical protein
MYLYDAIVYRQSTIEALFFFLRRSRLQQLSSSIITVSIPIHAIVCSTGTAPAACTSRRLSCHQQLKSRQSRHQFLRNRTWLNKELVCSRSSVLEHGADFKVSVQSCRCSSLSLIHAISSIAPPLFSMGFSACVTEGAKEPRG